MLNLAEVAFRAYRLQDSILLYKISMLLYNNLDDDNSLRIKNLAYLGWALDQKGGDNDDVKAIFGYLFKYLNEVEIVSTMRPSASGEDEGDLI